MKNWESLLSNMNTVEVSPFLKTRIDARIQNNTWSFSHPVFAKLALLLGVVFLSLNLWMNFNPKNSTLNESAESYFDTQINYQIYE
jgi:hypothetical protein